MTKSALVIGGGIAGIQASLDLADRGVHVYLVEKDPTIGGKMSRLDKTFPTNDCSACILSPKMADCAGHPNISMLTYHEVKGIEGEAGNFKVTVKKKARYVNADECTGCGDCVAKCPSKNIPDEFEFGLSTRRAIYIPHAQAVPRVAIIDPDNCRMIQKGKCGICEKTCQKGAIHYDDKDEEIGVNIVRKALESPMRAIAQNAGYEGSVVVEKVKGLKNGEGLNCATGEYGDMVKMGVNDPTKVTRTALQSAASVATLILITDCTVNEIPKDPDPAAAAAAAAQMGGGMGGMM